MLHRNEDPRFGSFRTGAKPLRFDGLRTGMRQSRLDFGIDARSALKATGCSEHAIADLTDVDVVRIRGADPLALPL